MSSKKLFNSIYLLIVFCVLNTTFLASSFVPHQKSNSSNTRIDKFYQIDLASGLSRIDSLEHKRSLKRYPIIVDLFIPISRGISFYQFQLSEKFNLNQSITKIRIFNLSLARAPPRYS